MFKYKANVLDICILLCTITLCVVYARKQMQIQDLMLLEQKAKIELLSKINISDYSLDEIESIAKTLKDPKNIDKSIINVPWGATYLVVPLDTDTLELRKLTEMYPGIRIVLMEDGEKEKLDSYFFGRSRTKF